MKHHAGPIVALLSIACADGPPAPAAPPTTPTAPPASPAFTIRGDVRDTVNFAVSGAQVQVVTGPRAGVTAVTDENGLFVLPGSFADSVTVRASKEGFHSRELSPARPTRFTAISLRFVREATDNPARVAGTYQMILTAARECTQLPGIARQRQYRSHLAAHTVGSPPYPQGTFGGWLEGEFPYGNQFEADVRVERPQTLHIRIVSQRNTDPPIGIVERIGQGMFLEIRGAADVPLGVGSASSPFDGTFALCEADVPSSDGEMYRCPVPPVTCRSTNHRLTWMYE